MIIQYTTPKGKNGVILWGDVHSDPYSRTVGKAETAITSFFAKYESELLDNGKRIATTILVQAWGALAYNVSLLRKGDQIVLFGTISKDAYRTEKEGKDIFKITAEVVIPCSEIWKSFSEKLAIKQGVPTESDISALNFSGEEPFI